MVLHHMLDKYRLVLHHILERYRLVLHHIRDRYNLVLHHIHERYRLVLLYSYLVIHLMTKCPRSFKLSISTHRNGQQNQYNNRAESADSKIESDFDNTFDHRKL